MTNEKNKLVMVTWEDAAYTFEKEYSKHLPEIQTTVGFLIDNNSEFIKIANNVHIRQKDNTLLLIDGFLIPKKTVLKVQTINL